MDVPDTNHMPALADIKYEILAFKHVQLMIAVKEEGYEGKYEYVVPKKPCAYSIPRNKFSKHLKQIYEQDL